MRELTFPSESYELENKIWKFKGKTGDGKLIGLFELIWSGVNRSGKEDLKRRDHKIVKRLKAKLREISRYKDQDEDARILDVGGPYTVILEEDEFQMLKDLVDANKFSSIISDEVDAMWNYLDSIPEKKAEFNPSTPPERKMEVVK